MPAFCLLRDAENYRALDWDLQQDPVGCAAWLDLFEKVFAEILHHAADVYGAAAAPRIEAARAEFAACIAALREDPGSFTEEQLNLMALDVVRDNVLRQHGLPDPFLKIKQRENLAAAKLYPQVVGKLHALTGKDKWLHLVESVFAGNTFDLGATATMHLGRESQDFLACLDATKPRPWLDDDFDALADALTADDAPPWRKAIIFVDNAGSDFVLGVMSFARELALAGTRIVLAANELPSLNDITLAEVDVVLQALAAQDPKLERMLADGTITTVSTGTGMPVIDLAEVSAALNAAAADADLVVLEGMGRGVETNYDAEFSVDVLRLALIKNASVGQRIGGGLFDSVCKYVPKATQ